MVGRESAALKRSRSIADSIDSPPFGKRPPKSRCGNFTEEPPLEAQRTKEHRETVILSFDEEENSIEQPLFPSLVATRPLDMSRHAAMATTQPSSVDPKPTNSSNSHAIYRNINHRTS
jgi:hypothetical protein